MAYSLNPLARARLTRNAFRTALLFGRGRLCAAALATSMLVFGRTPKYRIDPK